MKALTILLFSLFSLPLMLNAQTVDEMLHKVSAAIEAGQHGQAVSYFRQAISLNIDRSEMFYWTSIDKSSDISSKLSNELALAYKKNRNYDKAFLFYKELSQTEQVRAFETLFLIPERSHKTEYLTFHTSIHRKHLV